MKVCFSLGPDSSRSVIDIDDVISREGSLH